MSPHQPKPDSPARSALLLRSLRKKYPRAVRGEGIYLWDASGKKYLDFSGSAAVNFIGHRVKEVTAAVVEQAAKLEFVHSSQFTTEVAERFAQEVLDFAGPAYTGGQVFFTSGGSEAVESALKLARQYQVECGRPKRYRMVSRRQAYHGATLGALAASGNKRRREIYLPLVKENDAFLHVGLPYCYRCDYRCQECAAKYAKEVELVLLESRGTVAAVIAEPMSGATLGAAAPPEGYLQRLAELCTLNDCLFIADEVMTGWGRTGRNLAVEHWRVEPDILVLAKGLTSGYMPLGAVIAKPHVADAIDSGTGALVHGFTYNNHPLATAAGSAVLKVIREQDLVASADSETGEAGVALKQQLSSLSDLESVGDVRGRGLLWGVEFVSDRVAKTPYPSSSVFSAKVADAAAKRGVLVYPMQGSVDGTLGDHILIAPPAVITPDEICKAAQRLREAIEEVQKSA